MSGEVELTGMGPAVLSVTEHQELSRRGSPHLRFEVADVDEQGPVDQEVTTPQADLTHTTLGYNTTEAVPMTLYYRNTENDSKPRPTLDHLREGRSGNSAERILPGEEEPDEEVTAVGPPRKKWQFWKRNASNKPKKPKKFGWIAGVLIRCLLNIWGVMLFIRLSWVTGQAGIGLASLVILLSTVVTVITTLSMSAICTNGEVKGGGAYYLISRSLGPEFGGAIGIIFSLANAVAIALYVVGFAETVADLIQEYGATFTGDPTNDIRVVGILLVIALLIIALVGLDWEAIIQVLLLFILLIAVTNFVIGTFLYRGPESLEVLRGFTGYKLETLQTNFVPAFRPQGTDLQCASDVDCFFGVFAVFFPAATGILAGANISGDLKNPQTAIPKGTLLAIGITSVVYLVVAWMSGVTVVRDAPGLPQDLLMSFINSTDCNNETVLINITAATSEACGVEPYNFSAEFPSCNLECACDYCVTVDCLYNDFNNTNFTALCNPGFLGLIGLSSCPYGTLNNFQVTEMVSGLGPIITAGIFAATISSALTSLVSAPKVFQRVCQDRIFPLIHVFAKGGGRSGTEPIRAYFLAFFIAVAFILYGSLNDIALVISTFFLMAYTLINYSCFVASFAKSPGWRPAFKLYNKWVALAGAVICLAIMFIIRWYYALVTLVAVIILYKLVDFLKPDVNWGHSTQAFYYSYSLKNMLKLEKLDTHVKNFRPQFLVLTGPPSSRPDLIHFVSHISREIGVMVCGQVILGEYTNIQKQLHSQIQLQKAWLKKEKVKAFLNAVSARTLREGVQSLLQLSGLGKIRPNTLVIGFKNNWLSCSDAEIEEYVSLLHDGFDAQFGVVIFRLRAGFDATERTDEQTGVVAVGRASNVDMGAIRRNTLVSRKDSTAPLLESSGPAASLSDVPLPTGRSPFKGQRSYQPITEDDNESLDSYTRAMEEGGRVDLDEEDLEQASQEESAESAVPDIITMPSRFEKKQNKGTIDVWWLYDDGGLAILLPFLLSRSRKWRMCNLRIFTAGSSRNIDQAKLRMTSLLRKFRIDFSEVIEVPGITSRPTPESIDKYKQLPLGDVDSGLGELDKKTLRHIRLGELLKVYSNEARLIVMTISVPQKSVSARKYMSWLEIMSQDLPPVLLMRGNQSSVLTFYS